MTEIDHYQNVFLFVSGRTPQIITETLFFFAVQQNSPIVPHEIHVITTTEGKTLILQHLLTPKTGYFSRLCQEYNIDKDNIQFSANTIEVIRDAAGNPLSDIRTDTDNRAAADLITAKVRALTADPTTRLIASMAGGRKTMGLYLGFALQFYGRPHDRLTHVLVNPAQLENDPQFFYPTSSAALPRSASAQVGTIAVAEVPFLLLGHKLPVLLDRLDLGYASVVDQSQQEVNLLTTLRPLFIERLRRQLRVGASIIQLAGLEFALYCFIVQRKLRASCAADCAGCSECTVAAADFLDRETIQALEAIAREHGERDPRLRQLQWWAAEETGASRFQQIRSRLNRKVHRVLGEASAPYMIASFPTHHGRTARYSLALRKPLLRLV